MLSHLVDHRLALEALDDDVAEIDAGRAVDERLARRVVGIGILPDDGVAEAAPTCGEVGGGDVGDRVAGDVVQRAPVVDDPERPASRSRSPCASGSRIFSTWASRFGRLSELYEHS